MRIRAIAGHVLALRFLPPGWQALGFAALGMAAGVGLLVGHLSRAPSYLGDSPETCVNCHVMGPQYSTWQHSSHAGCATCNDCHVPHDSLASQYAYKARDGLWHATVFTMRWEPQVIHLSDKAVPVVQDNCRRCHEQTVEDVCSRPENCQRPCWDCHREIPHGTVRSLSATPDVFRPQLQPIDRAGGAPTVGGRPPERHKEPFDEP